MRNFTILGILLFGATTALPVFSFFVSGCHTSNGPSLTTQVTGKKEEVRCATGGLPRKSTKTKTTAETGTEKEQNSPVSFSRHKSSKNNGMAQRNPFALPAILQEQQRIPTHDRRITGNGSLIYSRTVTSHNNHQAGQVSQQNRSIEPTVPPYASKPCVAGIFYNGKENFALVRWQEIQGIFRCGEHLGNGYYVKNINENSVLLCPEQNRSGADTVKLILQ